MNKQKGFTLVELLAVIVILSIVLLVAAPNVLDIINGAKEDSFASHAKLVLEAIHIEEVSNKELDISTINETNIASILAIDDSNYEKVSVTTSGDDVSIVIKGTGKYENMVAIGNAKKMIVQKNLLLLYDASMKASYPGTGNTIYDLSGNSANATMFGNVSFVEAGLNSYFNFPDNVNEDYILSSTTQDYIDIFIVFEPDYPTITNGTSMLISSNNDKSLRFSNSTKFFISANPGDSNDWANPLATNYYINGVETNSFPDTGWVTLSGARTNTTNFPSPFVLRIGGGYPERNYAGKVAFIAMYGEKLDEKDVIELDEYFKERFNY